jgi:antitoxin VapB
MNVALTIKNAEVERLATEVAQLTGESKTQAVKVALEERRRRLTSGIDPAARTAALLEWLEREVWSHVPPELRGQPATRPVTTRSWATAQTACRSKGCCSTAQHWSPW